MAIIPGLNLGLRQYGQIAIGIVAVIAITAAVMHYRGLVSDRDQFKTERDSLQIWQNVVVMTTSKAVGARTEDGKPGLISADQVVEQINLMAKSVDDLSAAIESQNADAQRRADDLAERNRRAIADLEDLRRRARRGDALVERLRAEAEGPGDTRCMADPSFLESLGDL